MNEAAILLEIHLTELGLEFDREFAFHPSRKWRFDYFVPSQGMWTCFAVEIEGAIWTSGRDTRGAGYQKDLEKYREAAIRGYKVYRFSTEEVLKGVAREFIQRHLKGTL